MIPPGDYSQEIEQVNEAHKALRSKIEALVRKAGGDRRIMYQTTMSDGGEVKISADAAPSFKEARLFPDRWALTRYCANILGPVECIAEVGVETGIYSAFMYDVFQPKRTMLLDVRFSNFVERNERPGMTKIEGWSSQTIQTLEPQSLSFAYIDGAHDFKTVSEDVEKILPKMKRGGIIQFNDYATFNLRYAMPYGVKSAVNRLINSRQVSVVGHGLCPMGFDDVAVRVAL